MKLKILLLLLIIPVSLHCHKDRIERPVRYQFIFANNDSVNIDNSKSIGLKKISKEILTNKRYIKNVSVWFKTGEILTFEYKDLELKNMSLKYQTKTLEIPKNNGERSIILVKEAVSCFWMALNPGAIAFIKG